MKVYTKYEKIDYDHPVQMRIILEYLEIHGELHVSSMTVEKLYRQFSEEKYDAGWMTIDKRLHEEDLELLEAFANWLEDINL